MNINKSTVSICTMYDNKIFKHKSMGNCSYINGNDNV